MADGGRMGDTARQTMDIFLPVDHANDGLAADFLKLGRRDPFMQESVDDFSNRLLHLGSGSTRFTRPTAPGESEIADTEP